MNSDILFQLSEIMTSFDDAIKDQKTADKAFERFFDLLFQIENQAGNNTALISHVKMMRSLGAYLKSNQTNAHPDTLPDLSAIYENTKQLMTAPDLQKSDLKTLFGQSHNLFKTLKKKIASPSIFNQDDMTELSSVILAIDWEITDETILSFDQVVSGMLSKTKPSTIYHSFLKIMQSIGNYIKARKSDALPESVTFLKSVFDNFERVVLPSDLDLNEKKKILEIDIQRFKQLKQKIAVQKPQKTLENPAEDDFQPALSHVLSDTVQDSASTFELTSLPDGQADLSNDRFDQYEDLEPALSDKQPAQNKDIMEDLFNAKESPADELLDAIHLMDVHGNEDHALKMLDHTDENQEKGIQNFTPRKIDTAPIPEIGDRLDAFFNLEDSRTPKDTEFHPIPSSGAPPASGDQAAAEPGIVPFDDEDENDYAEGPAPVPVEPDQDSDESPMASLLSTRQTETHKTGHAASGSDRISTLQAFLCKPGWETDRWSLQSIQKECFNLKDSWPDDQEFHQILEIILSLSRSLEELSQRFKNDQNLSTPQKPESKGFFAKLKGIFSS